MSQVRAEWPPAMARRTTRRRRESKVAFRNAPGYTVRNSVAGHSNHASSPEETFSRNNDPFQLQATPPQPINMDFADYFNVQRAPSGNPGFAPILHQQNFPDDSSWYSFNSNTYTLASNPPSSPQYLGGNNAQSPRSVSRISTDGLDMTWTNITPVSPMAGSDIMDINISDMDFGSYDSFGSMQLLPTPSTAASDFSEGFAFPPIPTGSPQAHKETPDLTLTSAYIYIF